MNHLSILTTAQGLSLALALHAQSIPCSIYELRSTSAKSTGALMLSPNALRILNSLGVFERIRVKGYNFTNIAFKNEDEETTDLYPLGDEHRYGYKALRIYRQILLDELRSMVHACDIAVNYGKNFSHVISESSTEVLFAFTDGTSASASLLIGTDGIHSTVRKYVSPSISPNYSGALAITCAIPLSALHFPPDKDYSTLPVAIHGANGTFVIAPQDIDGSEVLAGTQKKYPEQTREEWDRLFSAKDELLTLLSANKSAWPSLVQSALDSVPKETISIWPYYIVPKLPSWSSSSHHSRVLVIGDAAHAIPPTAGQGASQAFEDALSLALLLSHPSSSPNLAVNLEFWQTYRQERIDRVVKLTLKLNNTRLPKAERESLDKKMIWSSESDLEELEWLYNHNIKEAMLAGLEKEK